MLRAALSDAAAQTRAPQPSTSTAAGWLAGWLLARLAVPLYQARSSAILCRQIAEMLPMARYAIAMALLLPTLGNAATTPEGRKFLDSNADKEGVVSLPYEMTCTFLLVALRRAHAELTRNAPAIQVWAAVQSDQIRAFSRQISACEHSLRMPLRWHSH